MKLAAAPAAAVTESMWDFDEIDTITGKGARVGHVVGWGLGWGGRIRTFNLLIQSQLRYRCATPQAERLILKTARQQLYSRLMTTSGFLPEPSARTVILIDTDSSAPISRRKPVSMSVFAL